MNKLTFCPFINGVCRSDCVFHVPHNIALNNGNSAQCELAAFICCSDDDSMQLKLFVGKRNKFPHFRILRNFYFDII